MTRYFMQAKEAKNRTVGDIYVEATMPPALPHHVTVINEHKNFHLAMSMPRENLVELTGYMYRHIDRLMSEGKDTAELVKNIIGGKEKMKEEKPKQGEMRFFVLVNGSASEYSERGYIFKEAIQIIVPNGFVAVSDEYRTYDHIEVLPEDCLLELKYGEYEELEHLTESGHDVNEYLEDLLAIRKTEVRRLTDRRAALVKCAVELLEEWQGASFYTEEQAKMLVNYPFEEDFAEVVARIQSWGDDSE